MASELTVQTIKGPTSGSNANKIIVPSGHTLDTSGGTLVPSAGQVVDSALTEETTSLSTTSTSWQDVLTMNFTPSFNNSILHISGAVHGISYEGSSAYQGSKWRYLITPSGGTAAEDFINYYMFHFPTGSYWGGSVPFSVKYTVSSTVSHSIKIQAYSVNGHSNYIRNRNGERSTLVVQEIAQ